MIISLPWENTSFTECKEDRRCVRNLLYCEESVVVVDYPVCHLLRTQKIQIYSSLFISYTFTYSY